MYLLALLDTDRLINNSLNKYLMSSLDVSGAFLDVGNIREKEAKSLSVESYILVRGADTR